MTKCDHVVASTRHHHTRFLKYYPRRHCTPSLINSRFFWILQIYLQYLLSYILKFLICIQAGNPLALRGQQQREEGQSWNQEQSKRNILLSLQENEVFILLDWVTKFSEKQSEWFGKRGINWHICCVISWKSPNMLTCSTAVLRNASHYYP